MDTDNMAPTEQTFTPPPQKPPLQRDMPPAPPQNIPPRPPQPPQPSNSQPQGSYYQQGVGYQPPAPPQQPAGTYYQQPQPNMGYQPNATGEVKFTFQATSAQQNDDVQITVNKQLAKADRLQTSGFIEISDKPTFNLGNFLGQTFCSFWRFDTRSTPYDWWLGQSLLLIFVPSIAALIREYYTPRNFVYQDGMNSFLLLILAVAAVYGVVAEAALTARRLHDAGSSVWILLFALIIIPAILVAGAITILIGAWWSYVLAIIAGIIGVAIPFVTVAFAPSQNTNSNEPRYMIFHWDKLFG